MPDESKLEIPIPFREKNFYVAAARRHGMSLSDWILSLCREAVEGDPDPVRDDHPMLPLECAPNSSSRAA